MEDEETYNPKTQVNGKEKIALGETGYYDTEIYDGRSKISKFQGYDTSIAPNDEVDVSLFRIILIFFLDKNHLCVSCS